MTTEAYRAQSTKVMESRTYFCSTTVTISLDRGWPPGSVPCCPGPWAHSSTQSHRNCPALHELHQGKWGLILTLRGHLVQHRVVCATSDPPVHTWHTTHHELHWKWISGGADWLNQPPLTLHTYPGGGFASRCQLVSGKCGK